MRIFRRRRINPVLETYRLEAFSDGVFSIAITLLVLSLAVPQLSSQTLSHHGLGIAVWALWPKFISYMISFAVIGIFWVGHHIMFHYINKVDRNLLLLNILFLMIIGFFPFPVSLIGSYSGQMTAVFLYGITAMLAGIVLGCMWLYASTNRRLVDEKISDHRIKLGRKVVFTAPLVYALALLLYFVSPVITLGIYLLVPIAYLIPSPVDELLDYEKESQG